MKYLIQNKKEFAITVAAFVMAVINLVRAIRSKEITEELIVAVLVTASTMLAWYYNMPTSEENCKATGQMRLEKAEKNLEYIGEEFDIDAYEEDDDDDEDDERDAEEIDAATNPDEGPEDKFGGTEDEPMDGDDEE